MSMSKNNPAYASRIAPPVASEKPLKAMRSVNAPNAPMSKLIKAVRPRRSQ